MCAAASYGKGRYRRRGPRAIGYPSRGPRTPTPVGHAPGPHRFDGPGPFHCIN
ncbi:hypothetical protein SUDANB106_00464 [Streptomyces sp. enrichment culture]